jgi:pyridoxamine 5'-phosphate oxidase
MPEFTKRTRTLLLEELRADYRLEELDEARCETNPFTQFQKWFMEAQAAELKEPNAMSLATATFAGKPSNRIVLLKEMGEDGFVFYTSYTSRKGLELETNPNCAATFFWAELERQVRIEGRAERVSQEKSEAYFRTRPKGSQLGAAISNQSAVLNSRQPLIDRLAVLEKQYADTNQVPMPSYWGGYRIIPNSIEFWQGRPNRLHDRLLYLRDGETWRIERLSP